MIRGLRTGHLFKKKLFVILLALCGCAFQYQYIYKTTLDDQDAHLQKREVSVTENNNTNSISTIQGEVGKNSPSSNDLASFIKAILSYFTRTDELFEFTSLDTNKDTKGASGLSAGLSNESSVIEQRDGDLQKQSDLLRLSEESNKAEDGLDFKMVDSPPVLSDIVQDALPERIVVDGNSQDGTNPLPVEVRFQSPEEKASELNYIGLNSEYGRGDSELHGPNIVMGPQQAPNFGAYNAPNQQSNAGGSSGQPSISLESVVKVLNAKYGGKMDSNSILQLARNFMLKKGLPVPEQQPSSSNVQNGAQLSGQQDGGMLAAQPADIQQQESAQKDDGVFGVQPVAMQQQGSLQQGDVVLGDGTAQVQQQDSFQQDSGVLGSQPVQTQQQENPQQSPDQNTMQQLQEPGDQEDDQFIDKDLEKSIAQGKGSAEDVDRLLFGDEQPQVQAQENEGTQDLADSLLDGGMQGNQELDGIFDGPKDEGNSGAPDLSGDAQVQESNDDLDALFNSNQNPQSASQDNGNEETNPEMQNFFPENSQGPETAQDSNNLAGVLLGGESPKTNDLDGLFGNSVSVEGGISGNEGLEELFGNNGDVALNGDAAVNGDQQLEGLFDDTNEPDGHGTSKNQQGDNSLMGDGEANNQGLEALFQDQSDPQGHGGDGNQELDGLFENQNQPAEAMNLPDNSAGSNQELDALFENQNELAGAQNNQDLDALFETPNHLDGGSGNQELGLNLGNQNQDIGGFIPENQNVDTLFDDTNEPDGHGTSLKQQPNNMPLTGDMAGNQELESLFDGNKAETPGNEELDALFENQDNTAEGGAARNDEVDALFENTGEPDGHGTSVSKDGNVNLDSLNNNDLEALFADNGGQGQGSMDSQGLVDSGANDDLDNIFNPGTSQLNPPVSNDFLEFFEDNPQDDAVDDEQLTHDLDELFTNDDPKIYEQRLDAPSTMDNQEESIDKVLQNILESENVQEDDDIQKLEEDFFKELGVESDAASQEAAGNQGFGQGSMIRDLLGLQSGYGDSEQSHQDPDSSAQNPQSALGDAGNNEPSLNELDSLIFGDTKTDSKALNGALTEGQNQNDNEDLQNTLLGNENDNSGMNDLDSLLFGSDTKAAPSADVNSGAGSQEDSQNLEQLLFGNEAGDSAINDLDSILSGNFDSKLTSGKPNPSAPSQQEPSAANSQNLEQLLFGDNGNDDALNSLDNILGVSKPAETPNGDSSQTADNSQNLEQLLFGDNANDDALNNLDSILGVSKPSETKNGENSQTADNSQNLEQLLFGDNANDDALNSLDSILGVSKPAETKNEDSSQTAENSQNLQDLLFGNAEKDAALDDLDNILGGNNINTAQKQENTPSSQNLEQLLFGSQDVDPALNDLDSLLSGNQKKTAPSGSSGSNSPSQQQETNSQDLQQLLFGDQTPDSALNYLDSLLSGSKKPTPSTGSSGSSSNSPPQQQATNTQDLQQLLFGDQAPDSALNDLDGMLGDQKPSSPQPPSNTAPSQNLQKLNPLTSGSQNPQTSGATNNPVPPPASSSQLGTEKLGKTVPKLDTQPTGGVPTLYGVFSEGGVKSGLASGNKEFLLNGKPLQIISGSIHYFRVHPNNWRDRLQKLRAAGFNTVETFVPWGLHEPIPKQFTFKSYYLDLRKFLKTAREEDLFVILRPGPFIGNDFDFGGLPSWMLKDFSARLRTPHPSFYLPAKQYLIRLAKLVIDMVWCAMNGAQPIIMVQIENSYQIYGASIMRDQKYIEGMKKVMVESGLKDVMFTVCNHPRDVTKSRLIPGIIQTFSYDGDPSYPIHVRDTVMPNSPLMIMEYRSGKADRWGDEHHTTNLTEFIQNFEYILSNGSSVNLYVFHGGTTPGFHTGGYSVYLDSSPRSTVNSFDMDAPLSEAGDYTGKYWALRKITEKYQNGLPKLLNVPPTAQKTTFRTTPMRQYLPFSALTGHLNVKFEKEQPIPLEDLSLDVGNAGYILYRKENVSLKPLSLLKLMADIHDDFYVMADGKVVQLLTEPPSQGMHYNQLKEYQLQIESQGGEGHTIDILVENMGRGFRRIYQDQRKGIRGTISIDGMPLKNWEIYPMDFSTSWIQSLRSWSDLQEVPDQGSVPAMYRTSMMILKTQIADTFLDFSREDNPWTKGVAFVNGYNLGRYWTKGPVRYLYVPGHVLKPGLNEFFIFELMKPGNSIYFDVEAKMNSTLQSA